MADVNAYATKIGVDGSYVDYCATELRLKVNREPHDGAIPYGANYYQMKTWEELETVLTARESYERAFLFLCLARLKNELVQAARP